MSYSTRAIIAGQPDLASRQYFFVACCQSTHLFKILYAFSDLYFFALKIDNIILVIHTFSQIRNYVCFLYYDLHFVKCVAQIKMKNILCGPFDKDYPYLSYAFLLS